MGRRPGIDWARLASGLKGVTWADRDVDLARALGCSRERARQARVELGAPKSPRARKRIGTRMERMLALDCSGMTPLDLAGRFGCTEAYAKMVMKASGKEHLRKPDGRCVWKYKWGSVTPEMWGSMTDAQVAGKLGVGSPAVVTQWRRRRGIVKRRAR